MKNIEDSEVVKLHNCIFKYMCIYTDLINYCWEAIGKSFLHYISECTEIRKLWKYFIQVICIPLDVCATRNLESEKSLSWRKVKLFTIEMKDSLSSRYPSVWKSPLVARYYLCRLNLTLCVTSWDLGAKEICMLQHS